MKQIYRYHTNCFQVFRLVQDERHQEYFLIFYFFPLLFFRSRLDQFNRVTIIGRS